MAQPSLTRKALCAAALMAFSGVSFAGAVTTFGNRTAFNAAVGSTTAEDFTASQHFPIPGGSLSSTSSFGSLAAGAIQPGVVYSTPLGSGTYFNIDLGGGFVGGFLDGINARPQDLTLTFGPSVAALGFDTNNLMPTFHRTIHFASGADYVNNFSAPNPQLTFFGFESSARDILSVDIGSPSGSFSFALDNVAFGGDPSTPPATVPEPQGMALVALALAGLAVARQKKGRTVAALFS